MMSGSDDMLFLRATSLVYAPLAFSNDALLLCFTVTIQARVLAFHHNIM